MTPNEDRREVILARLLVVLASCLENPAHAWRNRLEMPDNARPAIIMFDGDDELAGDVDSYSRQSNKPAPNIMIDLIPEIYFFVSGKDEVVGSLLNGLRAKILKAIYSDETLVALCANRDIRYLGFASGFASGKKIEAEAGIQLSFRYVLRPSMLP